MITQRTVELDDLIVLPSSTVLVYVLPQYHESVELLALFFRRTGKKSGAI